MALSPVRPEIVSAQINLLRSQLQVEARTSRLSCMLQATDYLRCYISSYSGPYHQELLLLWIACPRKNLGGSI